MANDRMELAGRVLVRPAGAITEERFAWLQAQLLASGCYDLIGSLKEGEPVPVEHLAALVLESGRSAKVLAGAFVEEGKSWSRPWAVQLAKELAESTDAAVLTAVTITLFRVILDFFVSGKASSPTSPSSSLTPENPADVSGDPAIAAPSISGSSPS